jgi:hypothetical protein
MPSSSRPREYLPSPDEISRACQDLHIARWTSEGQGDVLEVLRDQLSRCERERIADDLFENERVGAIEREMAESVAGLRWPTAELGLPGNLVQALVDRNIVTPKQLATELTEEDFLSLPIAGQTLHRGLELLKRLGWKFVPTDPDEPPQTGEEKKARSVGHTREIILLLAAGKSQRQINSILGLAYGARWPAFNALLLLKDALQSRCPKCNCAGVKPNGCRRCGGSGRIGKVGPAVRAVKSFGFDLAARGTAKVIRFVEEVRVELVAAR